jgi:cytohesin
MADCHIEDDSMRLATLAALLALTLAAVAAPVALPQLIVQDGTPFFPLSYVAGWRGARVTGPNSDGRITVEWRQGPAVLDNAREWYDTGRGDFSHGPCKCHGSGPKPLVCENTYYVPAVVAWDMLGLATGWDQDRQELVLLHAPSGRLLVLRADGRLADLPATAPRPAGVDADAVQQWDEAALLEAMVAHPALARVQVRGGWPLLHLAAEAGAVRAVTALLDGGTDVNAAPESSYTALHAAARKGHEGVVRLLLDRGARTDRIWQFNGAAPLGVAARAGHRAVAELLLARGADVNAVGNYGTALNDAVLADDLPMVELLLAHGAKPDLMDKDKSRTPLESAILRRRTDIAEALIAKGAAINVRDRRGQTPLFTAVTYGTPALVAFLLDRGAKADVADGDGHTPLLEMLSDRGLRESGDGEDALRHAAERHAERLAVLRLLLDRGAFPTDEEKRADVMRTAASAGYVDFMEMLLAVGGRVDQKGARSPLRSAVFADAGRMVLVLAKHGADVRAGDDRGVTVLHMACARGKLGAAIALIQLGAEVNTVDLTGESPLHDAFEDGDGRTGLLLLEVGADPTVRDPDGQLPLHDLATCGGVDRIMSSASNEQNYAAALARRGGDDARLAAAKAMLDRGIDPNAMDNDRRTPLHGASATGQVELVRLLLDSGAQVGASDAAGVTPLHLAAACGNSRTLDLLLVAGADPKAIDRRGRTPLHYVFASPGPGEHDTVSHGTCSAHAVARLLAAGVDANAVDADGRTALHLAAQREYMVERAGLSPLVAATNLALKDRNGKTALDLARDSGNQWVIEAVAPAGGPR